MSAATTADRHRTYDSRAATHARARDAEAQRSTVIARLRLATFLPGAAFLLWALTRGAGPLPVVVAAVLFAAFAALVVWHARVDERAAWDEARRLVNVRAIARLSRDWRNLPAGDPPAGLPGTTPEVLEQHPYAVDLDIFGRASLAQWLGPAATAPGAVTLGAWLLGAADRQEIVARQQAVDEIAPHEEWREQFAAGGILASPARQAEIDRLLHWAESPAPLLPGGALLHWTVIALAAAIWLLLLLQLLGIVPGPLWLVPVVPGTILSFAMGKAIHDAFEHAGAGHRALGRYARLFEMAASPRFASPRLAAVQNQLSAGGAPAYRSMQGLNRILGFADLRTAAALLHLPIQALTLWDFHVVFALERWRKVAGARVRGWMQALGELDALATLAWMRHDNRDWCFPTIHDAALVSARALAHPLLPHDRRVANDVEVGPLGTLLLVTGSNMSGKSTLLRAIGVNAVLAQAGACVCATEMRLPPLDLQTSIRVHDSLELGLSYFMAALARLKAVVDAAERERHGRVLLYLLDEILQGTNSAERSVAVRAVARHLLHSGAIGAMTTHDLTLAEEAPLDRAARLVHFTETVDDRGGMHFDYRLRPGVATSRNALRLMKLIGIEL